ncbi:MAG: hypothetical protein GY855_05230, partial [candidate division Zixibacteria bacterium]|nr:hypothetical protein [candidate division Zixibacteria bacterium]
MKTICYLTLFCLIYNITIFAQSDTLTNVIKWEESSGGNGHWYGIVKIIKEWSDADTLARTIWHEGKAGYLATITSDEENQFIIDSVLNGINNPSGYDEYNLGATCLDDSCLWITGEIFEYAHWAPSQPASYVDKGTVMMWGTSSVTYGDPGDWEEWYFDHGHFWSIIEWGGLPDNDSDGMPNLWDNCIDAFNPDQLDSDDDGHGDVCDNCPQSGPQWPEQGDVDNDGVGNYCDNCPDTYNPDQADTYGNSMGDACESPSDIN